VRRRTPSFLRRSRPLASIVRANEFSPRYPTCSLKQH